MCVSVFLCFLAILVVCLVVVAEQAYVGTTCCLHCTAAINVPYTLGLLVGDRFACRLFIRSCMNVWAVDVMGAGVSLCP